jgi:hypothetical protein
MGFAELHRVDRTEKLEMRSWSNYPLGPIAERMTAKKTGIMSEESISKARGNRESWNVASSS